MKNLINIKKITKLRNLIKKIPSWIKLFFKLIFITILILKVLGFDLLSDFFININNLKILGLTLCFLAIIYQLLELYLLYFFLKKNRIISEFLPDFIIEWLKNIQDLSQNKVTLKEFKNSIYINIFVYILIICLYILVFNFFSI